MALEVITKSTTPFEGQKPGTSGLRKAVKVFMQENYTENFVQSILKSLGEKLSKSVLVVGGDGRYFCRDAVKLIIKICAANEVSKLYVGQHGILSTPAVSAIIRKYQTSGGIILTASHNPGGPDHDFGIKFNISNGGPAPDDITNRIYEISKTVSEYKIVPNLECDISTIGTYTYEVPTGTFTVEVIDSVEDYAVLMKEIFDFPALKNLIIGCDGSPGTKILVNSLNGVTGPYVERIFVKELGATSENVVNIIPLEDFGGRHPDPNLTYAADLVEAMKAGDYDLGAAFDGDGDRNMILGRKSFFVNPSDSLAVLADNLECIPYFKRTGVKGFARSMPTGASVDGVAKKKNVPLFEVPTGWKYFGNLMDAGMLSLCGEESFGTGSDHIREKDGIWAVLAWLSVMSAQKKSVEELLVRHWTTYGRHFFTRYDYENCDSAKCNEMMAQLQALVTNPTYKGTVLSHEGKEYKVLLADNYSYEDPIDLSKAQNQGLRIIFEDGSRIIFRLSGTGSSGATVRVYIESFENDPSIYLKDAQEILRPLVQIALKLSKLQDFTGRSEPTVIT